MIRTETESSYLVTSIAIGVAMTLKWIHFSFNSFLQYFTEASVPSELGAKHLAFYKEYIEKCSFINNKGNI